MKLILVKLLLSWSVLLWSDWFPEPLQWKQQQDHTQLQQLGTVLGPAHLEIII
jgi:hypothetical protein